MSIITTLLMVYISKFMGLNNRFYINYALLLVILILFPVLAESIPGTPGFIAIMTLSGCVGIFNSISRATAYGLSSMMSIECIAWLNTGTGISGIIINLTRIVCLLTFGDEGDEAITEGTIVYFVIAGVIVASCICMHMKFSRTDFFKYHMNKLEHGTYKQL